MIKCSKCNRTPQETDRLVWQCTGCKKGYNVKLSYLQKVQGKKSLISKPILKCKDCTEYLDNGSKNLFWKCSCGNIQNGVLDDFTQRIVTDDELFSSFDSDNSIQNNNDFCPSCGSKLQYGQKFCPNCGKSINGEDERFCVKCGEIVSGNKKYCPNCGHKMPLNIETGSHFNAGFIKKALLIVIAVAIVVGIAFAGKTYIPRLLVSTEDLLAEGNYEKAYKKAKEDIKEEVLIENLISYLCRDIADKLRDPSSFFLRDVYYETTNLKRVAIVASGKNGMGGMVASYWVYTFDSDKQEYQYVGSVDDMEDEEASKYDDEDELEEKLINNIIRAGVRSILEDADEVDSEMIDRINNLQEQNLLKSVKLLDDVSDIYPFGDGSAL